jgi:hypothetical protein
MSGQLHAPVALFPGKEPQYSSDRRLGGSQSRSRRRGENSWPYRDSNSDPSVVQPVASLYIEWPVSAPSSRVGTWICRSRKHNLTGLNTVRELRMLFSLERRYHVRRTQVSCYTSQTCQAPKQGLIPRHYGSADGAGHNVKFDIDMENVLLFTHTRSKLGELLLVLN